jgi:hypothetical protein
VASFGEAPEFELGVAVTTVGGVRDHRVPTEFDTNSIHIPINGNDKNSIELTVVCVGSPSLPFFLYFLYNFVQQVVQKLVRVLMHGRTE